MRSEKVSFRIPFELHQSLVKMSNQYGYLSLSRFMLGLCLAAVRDDLRGNWIKHVANAKPKAQDEIIRLIIGEDVLKRLEERSGHRIGPR